MKGQTWESDISNEDIELIKKEQAKKRRRRVNADNTESDSDFENIKK